MAEPILMVPAAVGNKLVLIATLAKLDNDVLAHVEHDPALGALRVMDPLPFVMVTPAPAVNVALDSDELELLPISNCPSVKLVWPVPPCNTDRAVVKPLRLVMSELAPLAAAPRLVRALAAVVALVPPSAMASGLDKVRLLNVGLLEVAIDCGSDNVTLPVEPDTFT